MVLNDCNEITTLSKKWSGRLRPEQQMNEFNDMLSLCELRDLGFIGGFFTWCINKESIYRICERLDHATVNHEWCNLFSKVIVRHDSATHSDHVPIWVKTKSN